MSEDEMTYIVNTDEESRGVPHREGRLLVILDWGNIWHSDGITWNLYTVVTEEMKPFLDRAVASIKMRGLCD